MYAKKSTVSGFSGNTEETYSLDSKSRKSAVPFLRFRWTSRYPFFCSMLIGTTSITFFDTLVEEERVAHTNFILLLVSYVIVAMPLYYMQILLGQYTQMGVILLKYLCPFGHGVGMAFMVLLMIECVKIGLYGADLITYCLNSFRDELQWFHCPKDYQHICWNNKSGCEAMVNCINDTVEPATYYYFMVVYIEKDPRLPDSTRMLGVPSPTRSILMCTSWMIIFFILNFRNIKYQKLVTRIWTITFIFICINTINMFLRDGNASVIVSMLTVNTSALADIEAWAKAINAPLKMMALGTGFHVIQGSYLDPTESWESVAIFAVFVNLSVVYVCMIFGRSCMNTLKKFAKLDNETEKYVWRRGIRMYFVIIPMALTLHHLAQLWNVLYYVTCLWIIVGNKFMHVLTIEKSICDAYPVMLKYQKYVSCCICIAVALFGVILSGKEESVVNRYQSFQIPHDLEALNTFFFSVVVCWMYGVQKFCDDIHFLLGRQPNRFLKITWYIMPVLLGFSFVHTAIIINYRTYTLLQKIMFGVYSLPIPIWAIYQMLRYAKHKHLMGVFQSEEQYGPPDPKERYLRRLFNPRKETKIKRKSDNCHHKCLLNSKSMKRAVAEEESFRGNFKALQAERLNTGLKYVDST